MPNKTAEKLEKNIDKILKIWEKRVIQEVAAAHHQERVALRNSLPEYLKLMVNALSTNIDRTSARKRIDKVDSTKAGKQHGEDRAGSKNYTMDQLITEYHILRQVLCDVMEEDEPLTTIEREVIVCSIEQAVNDAATEYSKVLKSMRDNVSNILAHDLRGPLTSSKISSQLVLKKLPPDDWSVPKIQIILNNMDRLDKMIVGLLDANRLEAGQTEPIEISLCDLDLITREVVHELDMAYPNCFKVQSQGKCQGYWDQNGLRRILENLLSNAIKYGEENKSITISLSQDKKSAELGVHNFGRAIPAEDVPTLFDQFKRLQSSNDKTGWGIGLSMVKGMVDAHNGSIVVESDQERGTTFKIKLLKDNRSSIEGRAPHMEEQPIHVEQAPQVPKSESYPEH